jgi:HAMP domain-containing protein
MNFPSLRLAAKFNLVFICVFVLALLAAGAVFNNLTQRNARVIVMGNAGIMMENALAVRKYTAKQVRPQLPYERNHKFVPQTVPAYSARASFGYLRDSYRDYFYKEASLNPTNVQNKAAKWEEEIIKRFRSDAKLTDQAGIRDTSKGQYFYLSRPIRIKDQACLQCHTTPAMAPPSMVRQYGPTHGYGWKMNEVVAAQIVSVPMSVPQGIARQIFTTMTGALAVVLIITLLILNFMLRVIVVQPVTKLSNIADEISKGNLEVEDLAVQGGDEIAGLTGSFNRMHRSLREAIKMLGE